MSDIKWEGGAFCYVGGKQWKHELDDNICIENLVARSDFQLNEIRQGDYIEASELDAEQKYNNAVEVFELFGFNFATNAAMRYSSLANSRSLACCADGLWQVNHEFKGLERKLTYPQLMAIGKLKRAMIERDDEMLSNNLKAAADKLGVSLKNAERPDLTKYPSNPSESPNSSNWSDEHYNHFYKLTKEDIERGEVKVDAYFVNRMWKINSWEDTGAGFHILKTFPRIANNKNSLKRELVALKKQVDILCKLHGVDDES